VRGELAELQRRLGAEARAVPARQFHVTLAFLGAVPGRELPRLRALAAGLAFEATRLSLDRVGWFPRARVGWIGASTVPPPLLAFRAALNDGLKAAAFRTESRRWQPHVTLYREMRKPFAKLRLNPIDWPVATFGLVVSETRPGGVRYRVLERWEAPGRAISD